MNAQPEPVLVAVDGSAPSLAAVELGVAQARRHRRPLRLVHAFEWPLLGVHTGPSPEGPPDGGLAADADRLLADALSHARRTAGDELAIDGEVVTGAVVPVLLSEAIRSAMVVLGDRGLGGFTGLLLGSVTIQMASHSPVPVLVARGQADPTGPVVLGVDNSEAGRAAIEFGFAEAATRAADLLAVHAWTGRLSQSVRDQLPLVYGPEDVEAAQLTQLREATAAARARWPQVRVRELIRQGRGHRVLVDVSAEAQLLVVGARGRGGFTGLLLGSVSQAVLHHSRCPVAVVRPADAA